MKKGMFSGLMSKKTTSGSNPKGNIERLEKITKNLLEQYEPPDHTLMDIILEANENGIIGFDSNGNVIFGNSCASNLLSIKEFQIVYFIWSTPFRFIEDLVRTQKYYCPSLKWSKQDLEKLLNRRLEFYSVSRITNYKKMFDKTVSEDDIEKVFELANSNPRDLIHIFKILFEEQYRKNPDAVVFTKELLNDALTKFVLDFNYFEYYPRKSNARANTMDIYSYAAHLLKLDNEEFSKNQLNEKAGTGGSTNNYVVSMEKIGLIENIRSDKGNAVYKIKDPKVVFCQRHNLDLKK